MNKRSVPVILTTCLFCLAAMPVLTAADRLSTFRGAEKELCDLYLTVVEDAVDVFEPIWTEETGGVPNAGFFDFRKYGNWRDEPYATIIVVPGNGMVVLAYAVLLTQTNRDTFGKSRVPRERLLDHAIKSIRWCCLTSTYVDKPYPYLPGTRSDFADGKHWRRRLGWRADEIGYLTLGAALLWDHLDDETRRAFQAVAKGTAARERLVRRWQFGQAGNHDQVKQDLSSTIGAAYLCGDDPDAAKFWSAITGNAIDMVATKHDFAQGTKAEGRPVSEWAEAWNLYEDYSSDHHGHANIWYGIDMLFEGRAYVEILSHLTGKPVPETFRYEGNGFDGVLEWAKVLCLPYGALAHPHGAEYDSYYGAGLLAFCYGATIKRDLVAAYFERQTAQLLARHSRAVRQYDYHRGSWAKAAMAYLLHAAHPAELEYDAESLTQSLRSHEGTYHYRDQQCLIHRDGLKWASFSWGTQSRQLEERGLCGVVVPVGLYGVDREPLPYFHPYSLTGQIDARPKAESAQRKTWNKPVYRWDRDDAGFSTAGYLDEGPVRRYQAFFSFEDGPCMVFAYHRAREACAYRWTGLPAYFFFREVLTAPRRCYHGDGSAPVEAFAGSRSRWWWIDDALGMVIARGPAEIRGGRTVGYNWARKDSYKDKCDVVYAAPVDEKEIAAGTTAADVAAVLYPSSTREMLERLAPKVSDVSDRLPAGWRGAIAETGNVHFPERLLALVNFEGPATASLRFRFAEGAPILRQNTDVEGKDAISTVVLQPLESSRQTLNLCIETTAGVRLRCRRLGSSRVQLTPLADEETTARLRFFSYGFEEIVGQRPSGEILRRWPVPKRLSTTAVDGIEIAVTEPMTLELRGERVADHRGPAVEIEKAETSSDGTVRVEVRAGDRSGVAAVRLECDGREVGRKTRPPYHWQYRPGTGWHTFRAIAIDRSLPPNTRESFARTVHIGE